MRTGRLIVAGTHAVFQLVSLDDHASAATAGGGCRRSAPTCASHMPRGNAHTCLNKPRLVVIHAVLLATLEAVLGWCRPCGGVGTGLGRGLLGGGWAQGGRDGQAMYTHSSYLHQGLIMARRVSSKIRAVAGARQQVGWVKLPRVDRITDTDSMSRIPRPRSGRISPTISPSAARPQRAPTPQGGMVAPAGRCGAS